MTTCRGALLSSIFLLAGSLGCGAATTGDLDDGAGQTLDVWVEPPQVAVEAAGSTRFAAAVSGTANLAVRWVVDETNGGTVDSTGLYRAPTQAGTYHVRAVLVADSSISSAAQVTVTAGGGGGGGGGGSGTLAACASAPLRTTGPVYYYCDCQSGSAAGCVRGSDSNAGTSPSAPRQTLANAVSRFNTMAAGGTVAFCRGGAWSGAAGAVRNASCTAASPCEWRDYAPTGMESAPRPIFLPGNSNMFQASGAGYRFWNLDVRGAGAGQGVNFWITSAADVDICNVAMSRGDAGVVEQATNQRITIRHSQFSHFANQGILAGSNDLTIDSNYFYNAGASRGALYHTIYLQGGAAQGPDGYHNEKVTNNEIHVGTETNSPCAGTILVMHGRHTDTVIQNNTIRAHAASGGCYGIGLTSGGYPQSGWLRNVQIRRNRLFLNGGGEGIQVNTCGGCSVTDNAIVLTGPAGWRGIAVGDQPYRTGMNPPEQINTGTIIQNNSIYTGDPNAQGGVVIGNEGTGYVVENNATWSASGTCYALNAPTLRSSNNYCAARSTPVGSVFVNALGNDLRPVNPGPLVGAGSSSSFSLRGLSPTWSATDAGLTRSAPTDAGAFIR